MKRRPLKLFPSGVLKSRSMEKSVRRVLPRSLLGRSLLIVLIPLLVTQAISLELFYGNFLKVVSRRLSDSVTADIVLSLNALEHLQKRSDKDWFVAQARDGGAVAGFADLQASGYIDMFFVAPAFARQGVARALMAHLHAQAAQRGIARLWAHVSLAAEPFFAAQGFVVQERQEVERAGVVLRNARMAKALVAYSSGPADANPRARPRTAP